MNQGEKVFVPMVETITNLPQKKMKVFSGHSAERIEPVLGIAPEPFDPVDVVSSLRSSSFFSNHHVVPLDAQRTIRMPVIRIVQAARLRVGTNQSEDPIPSIRNIKHSHLTVPLQDPQHDHLAGGSPAALPPPSPANRGLVALDSSLEGFAQFLDIRAASTRQAIEALDRGSAGRCPESLPIHRDTQNEKFEQSSLGTLCQSNRRPRRCPRVASPAFFALEPPVGEFVGPRVSASITSSHVQTSVNLVRFG